MITLSLLALAAAFGSEPETKGPPPLDPAWYGTWAGTLMITTEKDELKALPMTLEIRPIAETNRCMWKITYGEGEKKKVRDYELLPKTDKNAKPDKDAKQDKSSKTELAGRFEIDQKNGTRLSARLTGNTLYTMFNVGDVLCQSRYELVGQAIRIEMTAYSTQKPLTTKPKGGVGSEVRSAQLLSIETAELKRVEK